MKRTTHTIPSWSRLIPLLALIALLTQFAVGSAFAPRALADGTTCVVTPQGSGPYPTIQSAVNDASCATIRLVAGTYYETVSINRDVTVLGLGPNLTTVNGGGNDSVFTINGGTVTLSGLTVTNGANYLGGGIANYGTLTVTNSTISGNTATYGGSGGGIYNDGTLTVTNSTISGNTEMYGGDGGGIYSHGSLTVTNSTISGNTATYGGGGGIANDGASLTVTNSTISGNTATYGGGIYNYSGSLTVINSTISGNTEMYGGDIYNY